MKNNVTKQNSFDRYHSHFAETLRDLMAESGTTQKQLANFVGIRPQSLAQYVSGETQPNGDKLLKIAEYFHVTVDYLLTGTTVENVPVRELLGLSENTVQCMKLVNEGYFEDSPYMLSLLDALLADIDFYNALDYAEDCYKAKRELERTDCNGFSEQIQFYEWKAMRKMQEYFMRFFSRTYTHVDERGKTVNDGINNMYGRNIPHENRGTETGNIKGNY